MKYCPNCGQRLEEGQAVCPNCGSAAEPRRRKSPLKWVLLGLGAVFIAALVLVLLLRPGNSAGPAERFISSQRDLLGAAALDALRDRAAEPELSTDLTVTASVNSPELQALLGGAALTLKLDSDGDRTLINGELSFMGSRLIAGLLSLEDERLSFAIPQADGNMYTLDLSSGDAAAPVLTPLETLELIERYAGIITSVVKDENVTLERDASVTYAALTGRFDATVLTFRPTAQDITQMLTDLAGAVEKDGTLRKLIAAAASLYGEDDPVDLDPAAIAARIRASAGDFGNEIAQAGFTWTLALEGDDVRAITLSANGGTLGLELSGGESDSSAALYVDEGPGPQVLISSASAASGDSRTGAVTLYPDFPGSVTIDYSVDMSNMSPLGMPFGSYTVTVDDSGEDMSFTLTVSGSADGGVDHTLSMDLPPEITENMFTHIDLTINASQGSTAQAPTGTPVDITGWSQEQLSQLIDTIAQALGRDLAGNLLGTLGLGLDLGL